MGRILDIQSHGQKAQWVEPGLLCSSSGVWGWGKGGVMVWPETLLRQVTRASP